MFWRGSGRTRSSRDELIAGDPYQFQALSTSTTIRLIKVSPQKVRGCIACSVYHFDEKQQGAIKYHALSYLWGDPNPTRRIYLKDQGSEWRPFPLHENLWQFLDHARRRKLFDQLFWTDHLCLDQGGHDEISQQVPRMHAIYRNAELVVVWLQLREEEQDALRRVVRSRHRPRLMPGARHGVLQERRLASCQDAIWGAMENPYWERVWIVQEVVVAKRVRVTSGDISVGLDELRSLLDPFRQARFPSGKPSMWVLCEMRAAGGKMPLWRILRDFTGYQSSRPVDRVYGLLGMVEDDKDGSSPAANIQVDYEKPILHVLLDAMFESSPPLREYRLATQCLGPWNTYDSLALLEGYIASGTTTQRHRGFARVALHAFEAFNIIKSVPGAPHPYVMRDLMDKVFSLAGSWDPTRHQRAALIGFLLARWSRGALGRWTAHRWLRGEESPSPWLCAAHRHDEGAGGDGVRGGGRELYQVVAFLAVRTGWAHESVIDACKYQSRGCDGSTMVCAFPEVGLRLLIKSSMNRGGKGWLSLDRLESGFSGLAQLGET